MSKYVKNLITSELGGRLEGIDEALLVDVVGLENNKAVVLRKQLREQDISMMVVKNSLAKRATEGTPLATALEGMEGSLAFVWGGEDFVSLAKLVAKLAADPEFEGFQARGGVMDGEKLTPERVKEISKWPSRDEQLSMLAGQILGPGSELAGAFVGPGGTLAGQIKQKSEGDE